MIPEKERGQGRDVTPAGRRTPKSKPETPFDNVDAAHEYVGLLLEAIRQAREEVGRDEEEARGDRATRRLEALRLVVWKLERLESHLASSRRLLHDLGRLRRLLLGEGDGGVHPRSGAPGEPSEDPFEEG